MELLRVPGRKAALAFGLKWVVLDPWEKQHRQVAKWRADGYHEAAIYSLDDGDAVYGLVQDGLGEEDKKHLKGMRVLAAAACAATLKELEGKTVLITIELPGNPDEEGTVAAIGLERGMVVLDQLCDSRSQLAEQRQSFAERVRGEFEVYGNVGQVHHKMEVDKLIPKTGLLAKGPTIGPLRARRGYLIGAAVAGVCLLATGGIFAWDAHKSEINQRTQLALLERNKPEYQYRQAIQALLQRPVVPVAIAIEAMRNALADFPTVHEGFELTQVSCPSSGDCAVKFKRLAGTGASVEGFRKTAPPQWQGITAVGQDELAFTLRIEFPHSKLQREGWPTAVAFRDRSFAAWQFLEPGGWRADLGSATIQAVPGGLQPKDMNALYAMPDAVFAMPVTIASQPWWYANVDSNSPVRFEALGGNTVIDGDSHVELTLSNKSVSFSARGLAYVQK